MRAQDQGTPPKYSDTTLRVIVEDADDQNPKFLKDSYRTELPTDTFVGELKIFPEPITAIDQDEGLRAIVQYSIMPSPESKYFAINPRTGVVSAIASMGALNMLHAITLVIRATQVNNADRYALTTLTIARNDEIQSKQVGLPLNFLQQQFHTKVPESMSVGNRLLALPTNRPGRPLRYTILDNRESMYFSIGSLGEIILQKTLDYEKISKHTFNVMATDGTSNTTTQVNIDVMDVNDWEPRFRQNHYDFVVPPDSMAKHNEAIPLGKLEAADGDKNDKVNIVIRGAHAQHFYMDMQGMLWLKKHVPNITLMHLIATATDTGMPPRSSSVPVTVTMEGVALAQYTWTPEIIGAFGVVFGLFLMVIIALSVYICKQRRPNGKNRVHSHSEHSIASAANLVNHEKANGSGNNNIRVTNPLNNNNNHSGSGSSISAGASTILAASLEREAQRQREREKENYTATVRSKNLIHDYNFLYF